VAAVAIAPPAANGDGAATGSTNRNRAATGSANPDRAATGADACTATGGCVLRRIGNQQHGCGCQGDENSTQHRRIPFLQEKAADFHITMTAGLCEDSRAGASRP